VYCCSNIDELGIIVVYIFLMLIVVIFTKRFLLCSVMYALLHEIASLFSPSRSFITCSCSYALLHEIASVVS
jgi:hypothetical protein